MSINPPKLGIDPDTQRGNQLFYHRNDFLNGIASCFRKQNLLHSSTETKFVFFSFLLRKHTRKNCRDIRNARGFDHTTLLLLPCWNSHLFSHPVQATEVHKYITMNYPFCYIIPDLSRSLVFILRQQRMRIIQWPTHCMFLGGTGMRSGRCGTLPSLPCWICKWHVCMGEGIRDFGHATHCPSRTAACVPPRLQTSSTSPCKRAILGVYTKNRNKRGSILNSL